MGSLFLFPSFLFAGGISLVLESVLKNLEGLAVQLRGSDFFSLEF